MAADTNLHSWIVGWLKIILPLAALALLSTLFLIARQPGEPLAITEDELDTIAAEQGIRAPRFSGVTEDGATLVLSARAARPEGPRQGLIDAPRLTLDTDDGAQLTIVAGEGQLDDAARTATLTGLVRLDTTTGYSMETAGLVADLARGTATSQGALEVQAPFGSLTAGRVQVTMGDGSRAARMDFTGGVRLLYDPAAAPSPTAGPDQ